MGGTKAEDVRKQSTEEDTWASEGQNDRGSGEDYITRSFMICISSPNIIWVSKSRIKRWVGYVACIGDRRVADLRERDHLEDLGITCRSGMGRQGQDLTG